MTYELLLLYCPFYCNSTFIKTGVLGVLSKGSGFKILVTISHCEITHLSQETWGEFIHNNREL